MTAFVLGVASSLAASLLFPGLVDATTRVFVYAFGWLPARRRLPLAGSWRATWRVDSERYEREVVDELAVIRQFGNRIYGKLAANGSDFYWLGTIDAGRYVTGTWYDGNGGGYHGAFQLIVDPDTKNLSGRWIGYSTSGVVKEGLSCWERVS